MVEVGCACVWLHDWFYESALLSVSLTVCCSCALHLSPCVTFFYSCPWCGKLFALHSRQVGYMHRHGIVHRDLKLENWLMQTPGDTTGVKLIDFGLSKHFAQDQNMQQAVGSTYYVAPGKYKHSKLTARHRCGTQLLYIQRHTSLVLLERDA